MRTASGISKVSEASEHQSVGPSSLQIDELVENQDDQEERPRTGPERIDLQSAALASIQNDEIVINGVNHKSTELQLEQEHDKSSQSCKGLQSFKSENMVRIYFS